MALGGGSPQTFSSGGNPAPYQPKAQGQLDTMFQNIIGQFPTNPSQTPAGLLYPNAENIYSGYLNPLQTGNLGSTLANLGLQGSYGAYTMGQAAAPQIAAAGSSVLNTAFDPQQALYQRQLQQTLDQANVANSMAGIGGTPYGASNVSNAARNFGIDWQNNLLNRQIAGGQAGSALDQAGIGLQASSAALPYQTAQGIGQNALQGINAVTTLGNNQFILPQQALNDIESYLGLGQNASALALSGGNLGFNQTAQGLGGVLSGANLLFGGGGGGGLFGGGSSLLGGGSSLAADSLAPTTFATDTNFPISDIAGGGGGIFSSLSGA